VDAVRPVIDGVQVLVRVQPAAKRTEIIGVVAGQVRLRLAAPPVDGKANAELIRYLAKMLGVRRAAITIRRGAASRVKLIEISGVSAESCRAALEKT